MYLPNSSNQIDNEQSGREPGILFRAIQKEEVSSLPPAGSARHPPPTSAGLFETVTKLYARTNLIAGSTSELYEKNGHRPDRIRSKKTQSESLKETRHEEGFRILASKLVHVCAVRLVHHLPEFNILARS